MCQSEAVSVRLSLAFLDMSHLTASVEFLTDSLQMEERLRETEYITFNYLYTHTHTHLSAHMLQMRAHTHTHSCRLGATQSNLFDLTGAFLTSFDAVSVFLLRVMDLKSLLWVLG